MSGSKSKEGENKKTFSSKGGSTSLMEVEPPGNYFWIGAIFLLLLSVGVLIFFWYFSQKPVSSVAHVIEAPVVEDKKETFERFEGRYFSFRYNGSYTVKNRQDTADANGVVLETAYLASGEVNSKKIAMTVENLSGRKMEDSASYNLRKVYADKYHEEKFSAGEINGVAFIATKSDAFEKVIFIPRENYLAEIALTGPLVNDGSMEKELEDVVKSIQWKK